MHMSFRDIEAIIKKVKSEAERERGQLEEDDIKSKSKITQPFKLFSAGKSPIEVIIALDLPANEVRTIYREYWECRRMFKLVQIYEVAKYDLHHLLRLHRIIKDLGMEEHDIKKVFELAKHDQLQYLQGKVEYLKNEINKLEFEKMKASNHILKLNSTIDQLQKNLPQNEGWYDNTGNLYPTYSEPYTNSYSIHLSYNDYWS